MSRTRFWIAAAIFAFLVHERRADGALTVQPMSASVLLGETALFMCVGEDTFSILWRINGQAGNTQASEERGVEVINDDANAPTFKSNLTIPGTVENDNVSIQCVLVLIVSEVINSPVAHLTVLGIGEIGSVSFDFQPSVPCIQWAEPLFMSSDVTNIMYNVSVGGANLSPINAVTSETKYCIELTPCQEYTVTVTPFSTSPDYTGNSAIVTYTIPGDNYRFEGPCSSEVTFEPDSTNVSCTFKCQLQVPSAVCPGQSVQVVTGSFLNDDIVTIHPLLPIDELEIYDEKFIDIEVTGLPIGEPCYSNMSLFSKDSIFISGTSLNFTTYSVQGAVISSLVVTTEICIECIFAVDAPARGCVVLFSNFSSVVFNITILRNTMTSNAHSCTPVPESLPRETLQEFVVSVYDYEDGADLNLSEPAIILPQLLQVEPVTEPPIIDTSSFVPQLSTFDATSDSTDQKTLSSSTSPSVVIGPSGSSYSEVIVSVVVVFVILLVLGIILVLVAVVAFKKRLYHKFSRETMSFVPSPSNSPRLIEITEIDNGNLREPSIGQEIKSPNDAAGLELSSSQPPPSYPAPRSGPSSSSNPASGNPVYDDLAKFSSKPKPGSAGHLRYADLGPRLDGGMVHPSEQERVKYSSVQQPPKKVEYAVLQKPPKKRPPVKAYTEAVTYVQIRPQDQRPTGTGSASDATTTTTTEDVAGSSQRGILTAPKAPANHSQLEFTSSLERSVRSATGGPRQDLQMPFLAPEPHAHKDTDHPGIEGQSDLQPPPSWEEVAAQVGFVDLVANRELELTDFVSGKEGDTLPRDKTSSDQLRGRVMDLHTSIPFTSSTLPFVSTGESHSDFTEDLTEKADYDEYDTSVSCEACSEVGISEASQCVDTSCSSTVVPGQSARVPFSGCKRLYSNYDATRSISSTQLSHDVADDLVSVRGRGNGPSSATASDQTIMTVK